MFLSSAIVHRLYQTTFNKPARTSSFSEFFWRRLKYNVVVLYAKDYHHNLFVSEAWQKELIILQTGVWAAGLYTSLIFCRKFLVVKLKFQKRKNKLKGLKSTFRISSSFYNSSDILVLSLLFII